MSHEKFKTCIDADGLIDSLREQLEEKEARLQALNRKKNDLENALVRTRVQLNSLIGANSELSDKMHKMQRQIKSQELEMSRLKKTGEKSLQSSRARIDTIDLCIRIAKAQLSSSRVESTKHSKR